MPIPGHERRTVPRHLRDSEHETVATTSVAGTRAEDAVSGRARRWAPWLALVAAAAALAWWWLD
jgi:hypothetical protein